MAASWYCRILDEELGPLRQSDLQRLADSRTLGPDDLVRKGNTKWVKASKIRGLIPTIEPPSAADMGLQSVLEEPARLPASPKHVTLKTNQAFKLRVSLVITFATGACIAVFAVLFKNTPTGGELPREPITTADSEAGTMREQLESLQKELAELKAASQPIAGPANVIEQLDELKSTLSGLAEEFRQALPGSTEPQEDSDADAAVNDLVGRAKSATVHITSDRAVGSGFLVDESGLVATNYHVVEGSTRIAVRFEDREEVQALGFTKVFPDRDLAFVRLPPQPGRAVLAISQKIPTVGSHVVAVGSPEGLSFSVSTGIVSGVRSGAELAELLGGDRKDVTWIQTTAPISHGNSGGPLVNNAGEVVGMNTLSTSLRPLRPSQNINFAVAGTEIVKALDESRGESLGFDQLPPARELPLATPTAPRQEVTSGSSRELLEKIRQQGNLVYQTKVAAQAKLLDLQRERIEAAATGAGLAASIQTTLRSMAIIEARVRQLREAASSYLADSEVKYAYEAEIQQKGLEYNQYLSQAQRLQSEATKVAVHIRGLQSQIAHLGSEIVRAENQQRQLRQEWLRVADPFGDRSRRSHEEAIEVFSEWVAVDSRNPDAFVGRSFAYISIGNFQNAIADATKALELDSAHSAAHAALAFALHSAGQKTAAMASIGRSIKSDKSSPAAYFVRAEISVLEGQYKQAVADLKTVVRLLPNSATAHTKLALLYAACPAPSVRNEKLAVAMATTACELTNWSGWQPIGALAAARAEAGEFDEAIKWATRAADDAPDEHKPVFRQYLELFRQSKPVRLSGGGE